MTGLVFHCQLLIFTQQKEEKKRNNGPPPQPHQEKAEACYKAAVIASGSESPRVINQNWKTTYHKKLMSQINSDKPTIQKSRQLGTEWFSMQSAVYNECNFFMIRTKVYIL